MKQYLHINDKRSCDVLRLGILEYDSSSIILDVNDFTSSDYTSYEFIHPDCTTFYELTDFGVDCVVLTQNEELFEDALKNNFNILLIGNREEFMVAQSILDEMRITPYEQPWAIINPAITSTKVVGSMYQMFGKYD